MGKVANERRRKLFARLKEEGRLDRPAIRTRSSRGKRETYEQVVARARVDACCVERYPDLPGGFRLCHGCPRNEG